MAMIRFVTGSRHAPYNTVVRCAEDVNNRRSPQEKQHARGLIWLDLPGSEAALQFRMRSIRVLVLSYLPASGFRSILAMVAPGSH